MLTLTNGTKEFPVFQALIIFILNCPLNAICWIAVEDGGGLSLVAIGGTLAINWTVFPEWFKWEGNNTFEGLVWTASYGMPMWPAIAYAAIFT
jgi:hypothetical protein